nr:lamin tail domain-containing protein [Nocardiopsis baichengensis]
MPIAAISGTWQDPSMNYRTIDFQGFGTDRIAWGAPDPSGPQSALQFHGRRGDVPLDGSEFLLSTFTHENRLSEHTMGFTLPLEMTIAFEGASAQTFRWGFSRQDTPDLNGPVDDVVTVWDMIEDEVQVEGLPYRFFLSRCVPEHKDASEVAPWTPHFPCPEGRDTTARLMAVALRADRPELRITTVQYKGEVARMQSDEYVEILNSSALAVNVEGWTVSAGDAGQELTLPQYIVGPGRRFRVYTNEVRPEWGGLSFGSGRAIWNDKGDVAELRDTGKILVSDYRYGSEATGA